MDLALDKNKKQCQLHSDVLGYILSKLNLKEATICSLVSRDWRSAWLYGITDLDFDVSWKFPQYKKGEYRFVEKDDADWYVSWVNRVIDSLHVEHINRFRVDFHLNRTMANDIDRWLAFAFQKRVKSLEFDFSSYILFPSDYYIFPDISDPIDRLRIFPSLVNVYSSISNLQSLSLVFVGFSPQTLEFILSNCPLLEQLCIRGNYELSHLRISGSSLPLKHLQTYGCYIKGCFEIDAPNLSSFECDYSVFTDKIFSNTHQKLIKVTIPMDSKPFKNFFKCTPQLEEIVLMVDFGQLDLLLSWSVDVELSRLKRVELMLEGYEFFDTYYGGKKFVYVVVYIISNLLHGAPCVDKLKINFVPSSPYLEMQNDDDDDDGVEDNYDDHNHVHYDNYYVNSDNDNDNYYVHYDNVPTCHEHAFLKSVQISSFLKDKQIRKMLELLVQELEQTLPSCTQLLFLD